MVLRTERSIVVIVYSESKHRQRRFCGGMRRLCIASSSTTQHSNNYSTAEQGAVATWSFPQGRTEAKKTDPVATARGSARAMIGGGLGIQRRCRRLEWWPNSVAVSLRGHPFFSKSLSSGSKGVPTEGHHYR